MIEKLNESKAKGIVVQLEHNGDMQQRKKQLGLFTEWCVTKNRSFIICEDPSLIKIMPTATNAAVETYIQYKGSLKLVAKGLIPTRQGISENVTELVILTNDKCSELLNHYLSVSPIRRLFTQVDHITTEGRCFFNITVNFRHENDHYNSELVIGPFEWLTSELAGMEEFLKEKQEELCISFGEEEDDENSEDRPLGTFVSPVMSKSTECISTAFDQKLIELNVDPEKCITIADTVHSHHRAFHCFQGGLCHRSIITDSKAVEASGKRCPAIRNTIEGVINVSSHFSRSDGNSYLKKKNNENREKDRVLLQTLKSQNPQLKRLPDDKKLPTIPTLKTQCETRFTTLMPTMNAYEKSKEHVKFYLGGKGKYDKIQNINKAVVTEYNEFYDESHADIITEWEKIKHPVVNQILTDIQYLLAKAKVLPNDSKTMKRMERKYTESVEKILFLGYGSQIRLGCLIYLLIYSK